MWLDAKSRTTVSLGRSAGIFSKLRDIHWTTVMPLFSIQWQLVGQAITGVFVMSNPKSKPHMRAKQSKIGVFLGISGPDMSCIFSSNLPQVLSGQSNHSFTSFLALNCSNCSFISLPKCWNYRFIRTPGLILKESFKIDLIDFPVIFWNRFQKELIHKIELLAKRFPAGNCNLKIYCEHVDSLRELGAAWWATPESTCHVVHWKKQRTVLFSSRQTNIQVLRCSRRWRKVAGGARVMNQTHPDSDSCGDKSFSKCTGSSPLSSQIEPSEGRPHNAYKRIMWL